MKSIASAACVLALTASSGSLLGKDDCVFDQAYLAKTLAGLAARNPGGLVNLEDHQVSWPLPKGHVVSVGHGGCVDLGTTVELRFPGNREPSTKEAVRQLLAAVSRCWSRQDADGIASILGNRQFKAQIDAAGRIGLESNRDPDSPFFPGFRLRYPETTRSYPGRRRSGTRHFIPADPTSWRGLLGRQARQWPFVATGHIG